MVEKPGSYLNHFVWCLHLIGSANKQVKITINIYSQIYIYFILTFKK